MNNRKRNVARMLLIALPFVLLISACEKRQTGEPDKTGSWAQISEPVQRPENWRRIVSSSEFQLGERVKRGTWQLPEGEQDYFEVQYGTYPSLDGSTVAVPMAIEFARQHLGLSDEDAAGMTSFSTTHYAYLNLIDKTSNSGGILPSSEVFMDDDCPVDLIIVTQPSEEELIAAQEKGVTLVTRPVCYDAFVFITHKDNPVENLTIEQIQGIYTGEITRWSSLGGNPSPIVAYQREENSGSQTAMEQLVMRGKRMLPPEKVRIAAGMGMLVDAVAEYTNNTSSIGYTYKYYIDTLYKNENIKILQVNGVSPSMENLQSQAYPFTVCYYGVIRGGEEQKTGGKFLDWMVSAEGQRCIAQAGYVPLG